jgi:hypothetical protein
VVVHLLLILKYLLAHPAPVLLYSHLLVIPGRKGFLFLLRISLSDLLSVLPQLLLFLQTLLLLLFFFSLLLRIFLTLLSKLEFLIPRITLLDVVKQLKNRIIELFAFLLTLLFVLGLNQTFNSTIWRSVRVILIRI